MKIARKAVQEFYQSRDAILKCEFIIQYYTEKELTLTLSNCTELELSLDPTGMHTLIQVFMYYVKYTIHCVIIIAMSKLRKHPGEVQH